MCLLIIMHFGTEKGLKCNVLRFMWPTFSSFNSQISRSFTELQKYFLWQVSQLVWSLWYSYVCIFSLLLEWSWLTVEEHLMEKEFIFTWKNFLEELNYVFSWNGLYTFIAMSYRQDIYTDCLMFLTVHQDDENVT